MVMPGTSLWRNSAWRDEFRGGRLLAQRVDEAHNVEKVLSFIPVKIKGVPGESVSGLVVRSVKTGEERELPVGGIFMAVGQTPASELVKGLAELTENGYIKCDERMRTSLPGLFAAGDVRDTVLRQVVTSCADGAIAAEQAAAYLSEQ
jgi:thioredoxin reductase (NADPH)